MPPVTRRTMLAMTGATLAACAGGCVSTRRVDMPFLSAGDYARALMRRQLSAVEAVDDAIARIEALDPHINAVVIRDFERARIAAAEADRAIARGDRGALLGVPMTVKDHLDVGGLPTTLGVPEDRNKIAAQDALLVTRLKRAGAVILGKTNVPFRLGDWQAYNDIYGTTRNPWNLARTSGGSSGGAAAALAAGLVSLEIGSDLAGSIRVPANFCGVYGHKATSGNSPGAGYLSAMGPMARTTSDLSLVLDILHGPNAAGSTEEKLDLRPARHSRLQDYRVLFLDTHPLLPTSSDVKNVLHRRVEALEGLGVRVSRASALLPDLASMGRKFMLLLSPAKYQDSPHFEGPATEQTIAAIHQERVRVASQWDTFFREFDVILCPTMPTAAFAHDHSPMRARRLDIDGRPVAYVDQVMWQGVANFVGLPATAVPLEIDRDGLPVGAQIVGPFLEDYTTIAFARLMEERFGGFQSPPAIRAS